MLIFISFILMIIFGLFWKSREKSFGQRGNPQRGFLKTGGAGGAASARGSGQFDSLGPRTIFLGTNAQAKLQKTSPRTYRELPLQEPMKIIWG